MDDEQDMFASHHREKMTNEWIFLKSYGCNLDPIDTNGHFMMTTVASGFIYISWR